MKKIDFTKKQILIIAASFAAGLFLFVLSAVIKKIMGTAQWDGQIMNLANVNFVDRALAHPYNRLLDLVSNATLTIPHLTAGIICICIPFLVAAASLVKKQSEDVFEDLKLVIFDGLVYLQCIIITTAIYKTLKTLAGRFRPYMYFPSPKESGILEGDFNRSMPSGHSCFAFIAFGFFLCWILSRNVSKKAKVTGLILTFSFGAITEVLRVLSGCHFLSDVICGGLLGVFCSSVIFILNQKLLSDRLQKSE